MVDVLVTGVNILELPFCKEKQKTYVKGKRVDFYLTPLLSTQDLDFLNLCIIFEFAPILMSSLGVL